MTRVGLYARVSTDQQANEGDSIQAQLSALKKYAADHNYEIAGIFVDDGVSGTLLNERDELQRMLDDVRSGKIDLLIFTKLDRYFRNLKHYLNTQEVLDKYNVPWVAVWENYETRTPQGRLMVNQMLSFAQFEAEQTGQRINQVFSYKKQNKEVLSGQVPFGYKIVNKHYEIDPEKAEIARSLFNTYISTGNMCETMRLTQGQGLPKTQRGIKCMLQNRKYLGEAYGQTGYMPAIIDEETFDTVQRMLKMNIKIRRTNVYIFSGLIWCSDCNSKMTGTTDEYHAKKRRYKIYRCMYHYRPLKSCHNSKSINESKLEKYLVENLKDLAFADIQEKENEKKSVDYEKQIAASEKKLARLKELYINELISLEEYKADAAKFSEDIKDFRQKAREIEGSDKTQLKNLIGTNLADWYWTLKEEERRVLWRSVIKRIWFGSDKKLIVEFL